jgi:hypothetical protein
LTPSLFLGHFPRNTYEEKNREISRLWDKVKSLEYTREIVEEEGLDFGEFDLSVIFEINRYN